MAGPHHPLGFWAVPVMLMLFAATLLFSAPARLAPVVEHATGCA
jgi:hypothetical protein